MIMIMIIIIAIIIPPEKILSIYFVNWINRIKDMQFIMKYKK